MVMATISVVIEIFSVYLMRLSKWIDQKTIEIYDTYE